MSGKKGRSGRKPLEKEIEYLEAVKRGAPADEVTDAVRSVLRLARKTGNPKALSAVLQYLVPSRVDLSHDVRGRAASLLESLYAGAPLADTDTEKAQSPALPAREGGSDDAQR